MLKLRSSSLGEFRGKSTPQSTGKSVSKMERPSSHPTCRKDMQCKCIMCLASFQATQDLRRPMPFNNAFLMNRNFEDGHTAGEEHCTPLLLRKGKENQQPNFLQSSECIPSFWPTTPTEASSQPMTPTPRHVSSPMPTSEKKASLETSSKKGRRWGKWCIATLLVCLAVDICSPKFMCRLFPPSLNVDEVMGMVSETRARVRLLDRLDLLERRLSQTVPGQVFSNCTGSRGSWRLAESGAFIHSSCEIYSSMAEKVQLWGYPIKTAGVLGRASRDRCFAVISGRVIEWREGRVEYVMHIEGERWTHPKWAASTIELDKNTWVVEYSEGVLYRNGVVSALLYLIRFRFGVLMLHLKNDFTSNMFQKLPKEIHRVGINVLPT